MKRTIRAYLNAHKNKNKKEKGDKEEPRNRES